MGHYKKQMDLFTSNVLLYMFPFILDWFDAVLRQGGHPRND